jgi:hypothetical protein
MLFMILNMAEETVSSKNINVNFLNGKIKRKKNEKYYCRISNNCESITKI